MDGYFLIFLIAPPVGSTILKDSSHIAELGLVCAGIKVQKISEKNDLSQNQM